MSLSGRCSPCCTVGYRYVCRDGSRIAVAYPGAARHVAAALDHDRIDEVLVQMVDEPITRFSNVPEQR